MTDNRALGPNLRAFDERGRTVPALEATGAVRLPLLEPGVHVWHVPLVVAEGGATRMIEALSREERDRMNTFHSNAHRRRFAVAHGAVRMLLAQHLQQHPSDLTFAVGAHGKPRLVPASALEFNLTHSGGLALVALSCRGAVGVDVEDLGRRPFDLQALARRVLAPPEQEWFASVAEPARAAAFLQLWACKEAVSKAAGGGFTAGFASIRLEPERLASGQPQETYAAGSYWRLRILDVGGGYVGAVAVAALPEEH